MTKSLKFLPLCCAALLNLGAGSAVVLAQEEDPAPKPAARAIPMLTDNSGTTIDANQNTTDATLPDTRPLTGIQTPTLGSQELRHSYWLPGFEYSSISQSRSLATNQPGWSTNNYFGGNLGLLSAWSHSQLALNYSGGGFVTSDRNLNNGFYHELGAVQSFNWARWRLDFLDEFRYLPETQFGFGAATNLAMPGVQGALAPATPDLGQNLTLAPSIFAATGPYYTNSFATQATYALTPRASMTMAGDYGVLRFSKAGSVDEDQAGAQFGYGYAITRTDSLGAVYRFSSYHFLGNPEAIGVHAFNFAYGRKITGHLALQLFAGPELAKFRIPLANDTQRLLTSASAALKYAFERGEVSLGYHHGVTGGSGILIGANTDAVSFAATRQISRSWTLRGSVGYDQNRDLANSSQRFNSWFTTAGFARPLGANANLTFGYDARFQSSGQGTCAGPCFTSFTQHQISLGLQWSAHPIVIR
jgi:hypothetical protein